MVYLHNDDGQSYLARYDKREELYRSPNFSSLQWHINLREGGFFFNRVKTSERDFFVPTHYFFEMGITIIEEEILRGEFKLYAGKDEIRKGMEENNNPSYEFIEKITNGLRF